MMNKGKAQVIGASADILLWNDGGSVRKDDCCFVKKVIIHTCTLKLLS